MNPIIRSRLSIMMFLQFFVWGSWAVTMSTYLTEIGFSGVEIAAAYSTTAWAAIISPLFMGLIADRFFPAEKVLGVLHLIGGGLMYWVTTITEPGLYFWVLLGYALCYMPGLALVNAISFHQMTDTATQFPGIRMLGTFGWIAAGTIIGRMGIEDTVIPLQIAAGSSVLLGVYCFTLPHTPPKGRGEKFSFSEAMGLDALKLMTDRSFAVFVISSLLICIPLAFYYNFTNLFLNEVGMAEPAFKMTFGQWSEVGFLLIMPLFFARLGVKYMMLIGMAAWATRYVFFAYGDADTLIFMLYTGIILHGICFDFFFVTGQIYVDKRAPAHLRASAQGFIALITYGVGMVIGAKISGEIVDKFAIVDAAGEITGHDWKQIWLIPGGMAFVIIVLFVLLFKNGRGDGGKEAVST